MLRPNRTTILGLLLLLVVAIWRRSPWARRKLAASIERLERELLPWLFPDLPKKRSYIPLAQIEGLKKETKQPSTMVHLLTDYYLPPLQEALDEQRCPSCGMSLRTSIQRDYWKPGQSLIIRTHCTGSYAALIAQVRYVNPDDVCRAGPWMTTISATYREPDYVASYLTAMLNQHKRQLKEAHGTTSGGNAESSSRADVGSTVSEVRRGGLPQEPEGISLHPDRAAHRSVAGGLRI